MARYCLLGVKTLTFLFLFVAFLTGPDSAIHAGEKKEKAKVPVPGAVSGNYGLQYERSILSGVGLDDVFEFNSLMTTPFGPAYANIFTPPNFLECAPPQGGVFSYALCYYSGPDFPTGLSVDNPALPCTLSPDGKIADCTCYEISTDVVPSKIPYFVDINAISNLAVYNKTVDVCGTDGSLCQPGTKGVLAPVCDAINANLLVPGADLISVFSPVKKLDYFSGSTQCHDEGALYAGCMTSPCYRTGEQDADGNDLVQCSCPIFEGPFEIGQGLQEGMLPLPCNPPGDHVWSAAHNPETFTAIDPPPPLTVGCFPDLPPDSGCPLFDESTEYAVNPSDALCAAVCPAYQDSSRLGDGDGIQVAFTCDATLCTTLGLGQDLPFPPSATMEARSDLIGQSCEGLGASLGALDLAAVLLVEQLSECSCCASQVCGCEDPNSPTDAEIGVLNELQRAVGVDPQCDINDTLCGIP